MIKFDNAGFIPVVVQDANNDQVLMVATMNEEALRLTRETGLAHYYSRSRDKIWLKGEQSGHVQEVHDIYVNCEETSLLLKVVQRGPGSCHTGYSSCYYRRLQPDDSYETVGERVFDPDQVYGTPTEAPQAEATQVEPLSEEEKTQVEAGLRQLYGVYIYLRDNDLTGQSNTSRLLQEKSINYLASRLGDELQELAGVQDGTHVHTGRHEDTVLEGSQVGYWLMLCAASKNIKYDEVKPHEAMLHGYTLPGHLTFEQAEECLNLLISDQRTENIQGLIMGFTTIGKACAEAGVSPLEPIEYDLAQMRRKGLVS
jgi:phosphoribosyl-AMP cyclohydrolase